MTEKDMAKHPWHLLIIATLTLVISACDNAAPVSAAEAQINDKFNAFVKVANGESSITFGSLPEAFYHYRHEVVPQLATGKPLDKYYVVNPAILSAISSGLAKGVSLPGELPQLERAAQQYKTSIDRMIPLSKRLYDYSQQQAYIKDGGKLARRSNEHTALTLPRCWRRGIAF